MRFKASRLGSEIQEWAGIHSLATARAVTTAVSAGTLALINADSNTATGAGALLVNTTGTENVAIGTNALIFNDSGSFNNAVGTYALSNNVDGIGNNALGDLALNTNVHGQENTALGDLALENNDSTGNGEGNINTAVGASALSGNTDGGGNNALGYSALRDNSTGSDNQAIGVFALTSNSTGSKNIAIGSFSGGNVISANNVICVGDFVIGSNEDNTSYIGNVNTTEQAPDSNTAFVTVRLSDGRLGHQPITMRNANSELEKTVKQLKSVVTRQETIISQQQKAMQIFTARLEDQAAQIQRVSAQLELNQHTPRTVALKYWETIADNLRKAGWSWGCVSAVDSKGRAIWIADAHRGDGRRFVAADAKLRFGNLNRRSALAANCFDRTDGEPGPLKLSRKLSNEAVRYPGIVRVACGDQIPVVNVV